VSDHVGHKGTCVLAWSAAFFVPVALILGIGWPWLERVRTIEREIQSLDDQRSSYHRLLQTLPTLKAELEQVRSNKDVEHLYFDAKTPALAGAELQREVQKMVTSAGGQVTSTQLLPSVEGEQPPTVRVRTQIQGDTDALLDVLYQIEKARPFLFVDQLTVRAPPQPRVVGRNPRAGRPRPVRRQFPQRQLTMRLDVFGYALGETP